LPRNRSAHALRAARARGLGEGYHGGRTLKALAVLVVTGRHALLRAIDTPSWRTERRRGAVAYFLVVTLTRWCERVANRIAGSASMNASAERKSRLDPNGIDAGDLVLFD
ncbi:MAG: hypothetical protein P4L81_03645, partial [Candidatus Pacebacteria bacterium]|nr:hypothetical protein [Candidatus Paceibacterota bacterium]